MIVLYLIGALLVYGIVLYNILRMRRNRVQFAYGGIDAQLKRRHDLIPNVVRTVEAYARHERELLESLTKTRARAIYAARPDTPPSPGERLELEAGLDALLGRVAAVAEGYPELRANEHFAALQRTLADVEEQIAAARRFYNAAVNAYHDTLDTFPSNLVAALFGFPRPRYFRASAADVRVPPAAGRPKGALPR